MASLCLHALLKSCGCPPVSSLKSSTNPVKKQSVRYDTNREDPSKNYHLIIRGLRRVTGCGYEIDQHIVHGQSMTIHSLDGTL